MSKNANNMLLIYENKTVKTLINRKKSRIFKEQNRYRGQSVTAYNIHINRTYDEYIFKDNLLHEYTNR